jgi:DNA primase
MAAKPSVSVNNMPDAAELITALLSKGTNDMNAIVTLISALATKPNISMPTVELNMPQINMPNIPMPQINMPQMPSITIQDIVSMATAMKGNRCVFDSQESDELQ